MLRVGSLFSGIGGLELGLERAGMRTVFQVEIDSYARSVLAQHWPTVVRLDDVRAADAHSLPHCDILCGGYPCQGNARPGKRRGHADARSGLWSEFARLVRELRPAYVIVENSPAVREPLRRHGQPAPLESVLSDLASAGYDAEWDCFPAAAHGAPHRRDRLFLVAYPHRAGLAQRPVFSEDGAEERAAIERIRLARGPHGEWVVEPGLGRMVDGTSRRLDRETHRARVHAIGNAVCPAVSEFLGRRIVAHYQEALSAKRA